MQVPQLGQRLEALEHQFDLPAQAIPLQHVGGREGRLREGREDDHVLGKPQSGRLYLVPLAGGVPADFLVRQADRLGGLAEHADPARNLARRAAVVTRGRDRRRPRARCPRTPDRRHRGQQVERPPGCRVQRQRPRIDTHNQPPARLDHVANPPRGRIPAVGQHMVAGADRELRQRFSRARPLDPRQLEEVTRQRRQAHAVVQPPQRPARSRFLHRRRIHRPDLERAAGDDRQTLLLEQTHTQRVQPTLGFLQPLQQRHVGQVRQTRLAGPNHRFPQRVSAAEVQQEGPQQVVDRLVLPQPLQRPGVPRQLPPVPGQERQQHIPVLVHRAGLRVMHAHVRIRRPRSENQLAPMG